MATAAPCKPSLHYGRVAVATICLRIRTMAIARPLSQKRIHGRRASRESQASDTTWLVTLTNPASASRFPITSGVHANKWWWRSFRFTPRSTRQSSIGTIKISLPPRFRTRQIPVNSVKGWVQCSSAWCEITTSTLRSGIRSRLGTTSIPRPVASVRDSSSGSTPIRRPQASVERSAPPPHPKSSTVAVGSICGW